MAFLLDTNVVSETRRLRPHGAVMAWIAAAPRPLCVAAITIAELQAGVELLRERDPLKAGEIESWIESMPGNFEIVAADERIFRAWARLMHRRTRAIEADGLIAATALMRGLTVATRNAGDFAAFAVPTFDPFAYRG